ncbi:chitin binding peritrophin-A domain-containing protein [Streptomyces sp. NPDC058623]|uniref:chitin binding peritrophin-A domain-containing protein n=1 Tax=Streptomyces sp. NPDC058623 TaxID=3346563 RepID=UPI003656FD11
MTTAGIEDLCEEADVPNGEQVDGQSSRNYFYCVWGKTNYESCPTGTVFDPFSEACQIPYHVREASTALTAGQAHLSVLPLGVSNLNATLTYSVGSSTSPVMNAPIYFTSQNGTHLCIGWTNGLGHASCNASGLLGTVDQLLRGYTATYGGNGYNNSHMSTLKEAGGHGTVSLL